MGNYSRILLICLQICSVIAISFADKVKYTNCGSKCLIKWVDIEPCPKLPCPLQYNQMVDMQIDFVAKNSTKNCVIVDYGIIRGMPIPEPLVYDTNACNYGVKCPIQANDENIFKTTIFMESDFPKGNVTVHWELLDDSLEKIVCIQVPVTIS